MRIIIKDIRSTNIKGIQVSEDKLYFQFARLIEKELLRRGYLCEMWVEENEKY